MGKYRPPTLSSLGSARPRHAQCTTAGRNPFTDIKSALLTDINSCTMASMQWIMVLDVTSTISEQAALSDGLQAAWSAVSAAEPISVGA